MMKGKEFKEGRVQIRNRPTRTLAYQILATLGWDGLLPLAAPASTLIVRAQFPPGHVAEVIATLLVPIVVALVRAAIAQKQLERACHHAPSLRRILALSVAITLLLLFEIWAGMLSFAAGAPLSSWGIAAIFYLGYLLCIVYSLHRIHLPEVEEL